MNDPDHVLTAIDNAIEDWQVSDDAMRWTSEPPGSPVLDVGVTPVREWCEQFTRQYLSRPNWYMPHQYEPSAFFVAACACGKSPGEDVHSETPEWPFLAVGIGWGD